MGCTLANSAVINPEKDAQREWVEYGSESSSELDDDARKSKWRFGAGRGHAELDQERAEERKKKVDAKQEEKKANRNSSKSTRNSKLKQTVRLDSQLQQMVLDSSFEDEVIQHVEGALTNVARKVTPFPY